MILSDLDGTLLRDDKSVSQSTIHALELAAQKGILFVPATGRYFRAVPQVVRELPFLRYAILINGALVYDVVQDKALRRCELSPQLADDLFARLEQLPVTLDCYMEDNCGWMEAEYYHNLERYVLDPAAQKILHDMRRPMEGLRRYVQQQGKPVQKIQCFFRDEQLRLQTIQRMAQDFPDTAVACAMPGNMEITHRDATKGAALDFLSGYLDIPLSQVMAFGDERNDCSMLTLAGVGVAMGNASPQALACADQVTQTNQQDGLAQAIHRLVLQDG